MQCTLLANVLGNGHFRETLKYPITDYTKKPVF
jgi:hypothetical protein